VLYKYKSLHSFALNILYVQTARKSDFYLKSDLYRQIVPTFNC